MRLKNYLIEKLINIDERDIQTLYDPLKKWVDIYHKSFKDWNAYMKFGDKVNDMPFMEIRGEKIKKLQILKGSEFVKKVKSESIKEAYEKNPLDRIIYGFSVDMSSFYDAEDEVIAYLLNIKPLAEYWQSTDKREKAKLHYIAMRSESETFIKSSIRHELTHYVDNSLHGKFASRYIHRARKTLSKGDEKRAWKIFSQGKEDPYLGSFEINAVINQTDELKRMFKNEWDEMTIKELLKKLNMSIHAEKYGDKFLKPLLKRMWREGLLGKQMKKDMKNFKIRGI